MTDHNPDAGKKVGNVMIGLDSWQIEAWIMRLGSFPVERVAHFNSNGGYRKCEGHVLKLENHRYALVTEEGCSCYTASDAKIDLYPNKKTAIEAFKEWSRGRHQP